jgi:hypothetical protein
MGRNVQAAAASVTSSAQSSTAATNSYVQHTVTDVGDHRPALSAS